MWPSGWSPGQYDGPPLRSGHKHGHLVRAGRSCTGRLALSGAVLLLHLPLHPHAPIPEMGLNLRRKLVAVCSNPTHNVLDSIGADTFA